MPKNGVMGITLNPAETDHSFNPGLIQFSNLFQNCAIYLLSVSLFTPAYRVEFHRYALLYSQLVGAPIVIETLLVGDKWGPKFTRNSFSPQLLRFTSGNCVQMFLPQGVTYLSLFPDELKLTRTLIRKSREHHDYYVFFLKTGKNSMPKFHSSLKTFKDINVDAKFIFVHDEQRFSLLCVFCPVAPMPQPAVFHDVKGLSREGIAEVHNSVHSNLHGAGILMRVGESDFNECNNYYDALRLHSTVCSFYEVAMRTNASATWSKEVQLLPARNDTFVGRIYAAVYSGNVGTMRNRDGDVFCEWLSVAEDINPFTFVSVVDTSTMGMAALANATSQQASALIFVTSLFMALVMSFLLLRTGAKDRWWRLFRRSFSFVTSTMVDQPCPPSKRRRNLRTAFVLVSFAWAQFCLLVNTAYKGYLFSSLASTAVPSVPADMEELAESSGFMITPSKLNAPEGTVSHLHYAIKDILRSRLVNNDTFSATLRNLTEKVKYSPENIFELPFRMTRESPTALDVSIGWNSTTVKMEVPEHGYILIGRSSDVLPFAAGLKFLSRGRHRQLILGPDISAFSSKEPIFVQSNTFYRVFSRKMYQLCSSGLRNYWDEAEDAGYILAAVRYSRYLDRGSQWATVARKHAYLRAALNGDFNPFQKDDELARPIAYEFMKPPLDFMVFGLVLSFIVFIVEVSTGRFQRILHNFCCVSLIRTSCCLKRFSNNDVVVYSQR